MKRLGDAGRQPRRAAGSSRPLGAALERVRADVAPATLLATVQEAWPRVAGAAVAAQAGPVAERDGLVTVSCRSASWAQELDFMQTELLERLREGLAGGPCEGALRALRFSADAARGDPA